MSADISAEASANS